MVGAMATVAGVGLAHATIKTVALQGEETPLPTSSYRKFGPPVVTDAVGPHVAVYSRARGKHCIFKLDPDGGGNATVACERDPSPDRSRAFQRFASETINASQVVAWSSRVQFGRNGVFRDGPNIVALVGDPVPAPGTGALDRVSLAQITNAGDVVFESTISGGTAAQGIFRCSGGDGNCYAGGTGTLSIVQLAGDAVPDRPGRSFCSFEEIAASSFGVAFRRFHEAPLLQQRGDRPRGGLPEAGGRPHGDARARGRECRARSEPGRDDVRGLSQRAGDERLRRGCLRRHDDGARRSQRALSLRSRNVPARPGDRARHRR
jgi:hypothetical protein